MQDLAHSGCGLTVGRALRCVLLHALQPERVAAGLACSAPASRAPAHIAHDMCTWLGGTRAGCPTRTARVLPRDLSFGSGGREGAFCNESRRRIGFSRCFTRACAWTGRTDSGFRRARVVVRAAVVRCVSPLGGFGWTAGSGGSEPRWGKGSMVLVACSIRLQPDGRWACACVGTGNWELAAGWR